MYKRCISPSGLKWLNNSYVSIVFSEDLDRGLSLSLAFCSRRTTKWLRSPSVRKDQRKGARHHAKWEKQVLVATSSLTKRNEDCVLAVYLSPALG